MRDRPLLRRRNTGAGAGVDSSLRGAAGRRRRDRRRR